MNSDKEYVIIELDKLNKNGRLYPTNVVHEALGKLPLRSTIQGTIGMPKVLQPDGKELLCLEDVSHQVNNLLIRDGCLYGKVQTNTTMRGKDLQNLIEKDLVAFRPVGYANIEQDGTITKFRFVSINAVNKDEAA